MKKSPELVAGLVFAIKTLDDYFFPLEVIVEVIQVSESWVQRHRERLVRRPNRKHQPGEIRTARTITLACMLKAEVPTAIIMEVLGLTRDSIYRYANDMYGNLAKYPPWYQRMIANDLVRGNEPMAIQNWNARRRARQWRTRGARSKR